MLNPIRKFLKLEAASGLLLMSTTLLALLIANSQFHPAYEAVLYTPFSFHIGIFEVNKPILFWINDGLMVVFFFLIGLEVKRECLEGHLSLPAARLLPGIATLGGVLFPALIYVLFTHQNAIDVQGWAIPTATDIAFALGVLSLFGKKIPPALRIFLMTVAVLDDLSAVLIITLFYAKKLSALSLFCALMTLMTMMFLNWLKIKKIPIYIALSLLLWLFVLQSGVHATVAGVLAAFTIPLGKPKPGVQRPLMTLERALHPWVAYVILPIFAFSNAGVPLQAMTVAHLLNPVPLGIMSGLFLGKQLGVFIGAWLSIQLKLAKLPTEASWLQLYGIAVLCGIGFTMSLFIGTLAFEEGGPAYDHPVRLGILIASLCSAAYGYLILNGATRITRSV